MKVLGYIAARLIMAIVALMCVDTLAGTVLAGSLWNVLAAAGLLVIGDIIVYTNNGTES